MGVGFLRSGRVISGGEVVFPAVDRAAVEGFLKYRVDDLSRVFEFDLRHENLIGLILKKEMEYVHWRTNLPLKRGRKIR